MTNSGWAKHKMREVGNTQHRPEQFKLQEYFKVYAPELRVIQEYGIHNAFGKIVAVADLADLDNMIVWRLNGEIHTGVRKMRDEEQQYVLEELGWTVIDVNKDSYQWNWLWYE